MATPIHWHALNCIHAAQAGKDIYCEKPLSYTILEGRRMVQAVRKYERVLQTGIQQCPLADIAGGSLRSTPATPPQILSLAKH